MKYLWFFWFPLLFLPNLGFSQATTFGTLEFSDFLIGPFLVLVLLGTTWRERLNVGRLTPIMGLFVAWALLSTITISLRYGYPDTFYVDFGLLKIAKMVLYGLAGILVARSLNTPERRLAFDWSLLGAAVVCGLSLWTTRVGPVEERIAAAGVRAQVDQSTGYSATNGISVMAAILVIYLAGRWLTGAGTRWWRIAAPIGLIVTVAGATVSDGRGGWVAALAGMAYLVFRLGLSRRIVLMLVAGVIVIAALYQSQPAFRQQVDVTIFMPTEQYGYQGTRNVGSLDDGGRIETWDNEAKKLGSAPILGTGFHHRGGSSGLWATGSHNFWLQMLLETGILGALLVLLILGQMWRQATYMQVDVRRADVPLKAAIVTAIVGGLGGEYFYGGIILFTFLAVYAQAGGLPIAAARKSARRVHSRRVGGAREILAGASGGD
jgi:O-antigen ligase